MRRNFAILSSVCLILLFSRSSFAQLGELVSPGPLSKAHSKFAGIQQCNVCHGSDKNVLESKCLECHKELQARILEKKGFHADKATGCMKCHGEHLGEDFDVRGLDLKTFRHQDTGYPLLGAHGKVQDCAACHKARSFIGLKTSCESCHMDPHRGNLPNCESCHSVDRGMKDVKFDHETTRFQLKGAHTKVACLTCHKDQVFKGLPFENCASCHKDPHQGSLGANCSNCHTLEVWKAVQVEHKNYPLTGKHSSLRCASCHINGEWKLKSNPRCVDCHRDPHLGQFVKDCQKCHAVDGFRPAKINHDSFKLEQAHAVACVKCHKMEKGSFPDGKGEAIRYKPISPDCVTCHKDVHSGQLGSNCASCHTITSFKLPGFDHSKTRYPLDEKHIKVPCAKCHIPDPKTGATRYKPLSTNCASCHGDTHMGQLGKDCERCHTPTGMKFQHSSSAFLLTGKHEPLKCDQCHRMEKGPFPSGPGETVRYKPILQKCATCHVDYHRGQFDQDCAACHTTAGFKPTIFAHATSAFPLVGAHAPLRCEQCHKLETFEQPPPAVQLVRFKVSSNCSTCHTDPHAGKFGADCRRCHTEQQWKTVDRGFHKITVFPLVGRHLEAPCASCHWDGIIEGTPTKCYDCHWIRRQDDVYRTRLGPNCEDCHTPFSWTAVRFDHQLQTGIALGAAHRTLSCESCHLNGRFQGTPFDCLSCHRQDYLNTRDPDHVAAGFPTDCELCHKPSDASWDQATFIHTTFPLRGAHRTLECADCHRNNIFQGTPRNCVGCHRQDYERTRDPDHRAAGFSTDCELCHSDSDTDWDQARFDHNQVFRLQGSHATISCDACHANNVYRGTPRDCFSCHRQDYEQTRNPDHRASGFSTNCENCHSAAAIQWAGAGLNHNQFFALQGIHKTLDCTDCHKNNAFAGTPRNCVGCHLNDYNQTTNPNHKAAGFPTNCENCHSAKATQWAGAGLNHNQFFALQGIHSTLNCTDCHTNNVFAGTPRNCVGCHLSDYNQTTNPNHKAAGFPTDCEACHRAADTSWNQAKFSHTQFPITSGKHSGFNCADCHPNSSNFQAFTCTNCHSKSDMDHEHQGIGGYQYQSQACYTCHPQGR